jgi:hypothetical protein
MSFLRICVLAADVGKSANKNERELCLARCRTLPFKYFPSIKNKPFFLALR